ncbi:hypothetical protein ACIREE_39255 [Streptomyces sp. NPDC102467]|uniref:hypothetical protein n=1 Tax=Streptomyces sp. NPDC102467 TaxID=3366179 RepID=UPI0037F6EE63
MGRTVSTSRMSRSLHTCGHTVRYMSLSFETQRLPGSSATLADLATAALVAASVPTRLVHRLSDAVRVSAQYVYGRSEVPVYRLVIDSDETGITVAVTDYIAGSVCGPPAWLEVTGAGTLQPATGRPAFEPLHSRRCDDGLQLRRTPDGHLRLGCHARWDTDTDTALPPSSPAART